MHRSVIFGRNLSHLSHHVECPKDSSVRSVIVETVFTIFCEFKRTQETDDRSRFSAEC